VYSARERGRWSDPPDQAVDEFLDWQQLDKGRSLNTVRTYERDLADFTAYRVGR
jgi:site-specific recombinase XerD